MKEMSKTKIIDKKSITSIKSERELLSKIKHPFLVNMQFAFQDNDNLYLVLDLLTGGDLRYHICQVRRFTEKQTQFFIACIILGLEYCHTNNIIHRDIKPENLVLNDKGYVHITDFGIAKIEQENNFRETSGTPGYMSPEVICSQNHTTVVDYFALGVIGYEFMKGVRPYLGKNRKEIKEKIIATQVQIKLTETEGWSIESADCINRLLQRKPRKRLGYNGAKEVKNHLWFKNFPWKDLYNRKIPSPFVPRKGDNFDYNYCNAVEKLDLKTKERYEEILNRPDYKVIFNDYYYFDRMNNVHERNCEMYVNIHDVLYCDTSQYSSLPSEANSNMHIPGVIIDKSASTLGRHKTMCGSYKRIIDIKPKIQGKHHGHSVSAVNNSNGSSNYSYHNRHYSSFFEANDFVTQRLRNKGTFNQCNNNNNNTSVNGGGCCYKKGDGCGVSNNNNNSCNTGKGGVKDYSGSQQVSDNHTTHQNKTTGGLSNSNVNYEFKINK